MIFNWYYGGEDAMPEPIFNAIHQGLQNDMQMLVPVDVPDIMGDMLGDPEKVKIGDTFTLNQPVSLKMKRLPADDEGHYFLPLFRVCLTTFSADPKINQERIRFSSNRFRRKTQENHQHENDYYGWVV